MTTKVHEIDLSTGDVVLGRGVTDLAIDSSSSYCAVGRDSGSIEVYGLQTNFSLEMVLTAKDNKKNVSGLLWHGDGREESDEKSFPRLFSYGLDGYLREWDIMRQREEYVLDTYGGAVWCGALASPSDIANSLLVLGCEDGTARLFEIPEDDEPVYTKAYSCAGLPGLNPRVLALCWNDKATELYAGCSTGVIQMFKRNEPGPFQRINLEKSSEGIWPIVHDLAYLSDGLLASASSLGKVEFWDPKFGTLIRSFTSHKADVLTLCPALLGTQPVMFAGGVDPKIVEFIRSEEDGTWADAITTSTNICDVRVMKVFSKNITGKKLKRNETSRMQLISANSAGIITILNIRRSGFTQVSRIYPVPRLKMHKVGDGKQRLMMTSGTASVNLWNVKVKEPSFLLRLNPSMGRGIKLTALCGKWIAVADGEIVKIWSFKLLPRDEVKVRKFCAVKKRATAMSFTKNEEGLLIGLSSGQVSCLDLTRSYEEEIMAPEDAIKPMLKMEEPVKQIVTSGNSYTCALGLFGSIMLFCRGATSNIPNNKVSGLITTALFFHAFIPTQLFCIHTDRTFRIWNLDKMKESSWSETQSSSIQDHPFGQMYFGHPVNGLAFHPKERGRVVLTCPEFFSPVDLAKPLPSSPGTRNKRKIVRGHNSTSQKKAALNPQNGKGVPKGSLKRHGELNKDIKNPFNAEAAKDTKGKNNRKDMTLFRGYHFLMGAFYLGDKELILPKVPWLKFHQYYPRRIVSTRYGS